MKICQFTQQELDLLRNECNFTDMESKCFELKAKDYTDVQLAIELNVSESTIAVTMRRIRNKVDIVLRRRVQQYEPQRAFNGCGGACGQKVYHTMDEWARIPDFMSMRGVEYIYADYRTEVVNGVEINVPRIKYGDGVHPVSELPFATMSIMDTDMEYWDNKPDTESNDFGKTVLIDSKYSDKNKFVFPTDGYVMLTFDRECECEFAEAEIYGASEKSSFKLKKYTDVDRQSKEVFVKKGMKCAYVGASDHAQIKFVPLV